MRKIISTLIALVFICSISFADWYVVSKNGDVLYSSKKKPKGIQTGIERRGEKIIYSSLELPVEDVVYLDGELEEREKSSSEKELEKYKKDYRIEEDLIHAKMKQIAIETLKSEGVNFKYSHE